VSPWIRYSLIRLSLFAVVLAAGLLLNVPPLWATIAAAIIGLCVSYIFFGKLRNQVALDLAARRQRGSVNTDSDEDAQLDEADERDTEQRDVEQRDSEQRDSEQRDERDARP